MAGEHVFVSHAQRDLEFVQELFSTVKNFPFGVHIALEEADSERARRRLEGRIANSDVLVAVLTEHAATSSWVDQEVGYALAKGIPVVPVYDDPSLRGGFLADHEGVEIDRADVTRTIFELLSALRRELAPLGALSVPDWYVRFPCTVPDCGHPVTLTLEETQSKLRKRSEHGQLLETACEVCDSTYAFEPSTIGFVRRTGGPA
ncbi:toll/interleukin-1 receptor domain-containing protein [Natrononativus amylolyticus]|uniref:toll/interleukin-1 receptor domain-containing protein n=1 Tax=Natrononativus amylolyticus TaxID=2963434 RepID=UPI0020CBD45A|nr:toll/interleukin-1 receptor domain-containing protein [Natrononativus amylolyticus]